MREIKFRAWDKGDNKMLDAMGLIDIIQTDDCMGFPDSAEFMQYTGLKDKNGKEIYEGDIVEDSNVIMEVKFYSGHSVINYAHFVLPDGELKVIGNIYENPDLLK